MRARRVLPLVGIALMLVVLGIASSGSGSGAALDPNGTGPLGAKALVLLLREYGARVTLSTGLPSSRDAVALVLSDQLDGARRDELTGWVQGGGRLVVADPSSELQIGVPTEVGDGFTPTGSCPVAGLPSTSQLSVGTSLYLTPPPGVPTTSCFDGFLVAETSGRGLVVGLGGAGLWTNERLGQQDNAVLAVDLLDPGPDTGVAILLASPAGSGHTSELDLFSPHLRWALPELVVAFIVLALWQGRRLGRPIEEAGVVRVAASEIVVAVGDLLARTGGRDAAAARLRAGCRATLGARLGLGPRAVAAQLGPAVAARTGRPLDEVMDLLTDGSVRDDTALTVLAQALAQLRQELLGDQVPGGAR